MPQYYFTIRSCDHERKDEHRAVLRDVSAALDYACRMVRDQKRDAPKGALDTLSSRLRLMPLSICISSSHALAPAPPKGR